MSQPEPSPRPEVVLVTRPTADQPAPTSPAHVLRAVISHSIGLATFTVTTAASITQQAVNAAASSGTHVAQRGMSVVIDPILDAVVPRVTDAVLDRLDLTQIVLDHVDVDAIVAKADIEAVIDRVPIVPIADYVIDEIDLPQIIRQSTGGVATDAINSVRVQTFGADQWVSRLTDAIVRRRQRNLQAPREPESHEEVADESPDTQARDAQTT